VQRDCVEDRPCVQHAWRVLSEPYSGQIRIGVQPGLRVGGPPTLYRCSRRHYRRRCRCRRRCRSRRRRRRCRRRRFGRRCRGRHRRFVFAVAVFVAVMLMFRRFTELRNVVHQVVLGLVDLQF